MTATFFEYHIKSTTQFYAIPTHLLIRSNYLKFHFMKPNIARYYQNFRALLDAISAGSGYYNLGWAEKGVRSTFNQAQEQLVKIVMDRLKIKPDMSVLDCGCGLGGPMRYISSRAQANVFGMEFLSSQVDAGKLVGAYSRDNMRLSRGDANDMPFAASSFDRIYSIESAFHYRDKAQFVRESARTLKSDGILAVADIVVKDGKNSGDGYRRFRQSLASPELFTPYAYRESAMISGFKTCEVIDLSPGVMASVQKMGSDMFKHPSKYRSTGYPLIYLYFIMFTSLFIRYFYRWFPIRYQLFLMTK